MINELADISQGNPGALSLLLRITEEYSDMVSICIMSDFRKRNLLGPEIWGLYKDVHEEDFDAFVKDVWSGAPLDKFKSRRKTK